jgi:hypothetical protein
MFKTIFLISSLNNICEKYPEKPETRLACQCYLPFGLCWADNIPSTMNGKPCGILVQDSMKMTKLKILPRCYVLLTSLSTLLLNYC